MRELHIVVTVRMENPILISLVLYCIIWLNATNPAVEAFSLSCSLLCNPSIEIYLFIKYNVKTIGVRVRVENLIVIL